MNEVMAIWRGSLRSLIDFYDARRGPLGPFYIRLFLFFVAVNVACYWLAMFTAFPELTRGSAGVTNFKIQFPVRPTDNLRNIYFGVIMGISASFPTCVHVGMFLRSAGLAMMERLGLRRQEPAEGP